MGKLNGKVAFITGGSEGIGKATALLFAEEGAKVAVLASTDRAKSQKVVDTIKRAGGEAIALAANVAKEQEVKAAVVTTEKELGPIDVVICSAGVFAHTPIGETKEAEFARHMDINVKGTWNVINAIAPSMKSRKTGWIVAVSSNLGHMGLAGYGAYGASKGAINVLTKCLAIELAPYGIHVNAIAPGSTATQMNEHFRTDPKYKDYIEILRSRTPSPRLFSEPVDMAKAALFLATTDSQAMYGGIVVLDEGISLGM
jgi:NAD(P)-dependent dehydrogenase (short-subunit alcohol dehydrogenase family)